MRIHKVFFFSFSGTYVSWQLMNKLNEVILITLNALEKQITQYVLHVIKAKEGSQQGQLNRWIGWAFAHLIFKEK